MLVTTTNALNPTEIYEPSGAIISASASAIQFLCDFKPLAWISREVFLSLVSRSTWQVFQSDSASRSQSFARLGDSAKKLRMVLQPIIEPVFLVFESN